MSVRTLISLLAALATLACRPHPTAETVVVDPTGNPPPGVPDVRPDVPRRVPAALAVTPDGTKAYVAHERDRVLTVIDAVADRVLREIEIGGAGRVSARELDLAVDPEGRHLFLVDPERRELVVVDVDSDTLAPPLAVPAGSQRVAFDFDGPERRIYVTNARDDVVLRWVEDPPGTFVQRPPLELSGSRPGPIVVLPDGQLLVGNRQTRDLERLDPSLPPAGASVARSALDRRPADLALWAGRALMTTFVPTPGAAGPSDGRNELLEIELVGLGVTASHLVDVGTDYGRLAVNPTRVALLAGGSGTLLLLDPATLALDERIELAPGEPLAVPVDLASMPGPGGSAPTRLLVVEPFRETVRPIDLTGGPPFVLRPEIVLSRTGAARVPGLDLAPADEGEWLFRSVAFFHGTATGPNPVTCATCHPRGGSDGARHLASLRQAPPLFQVARTAPFGAGGGGTSLTGFTQGAFFAHGVLGGTPPSGAVARLVRFAETVRPPASPFLEDDGSLSPQAQAGRALFEQAGCAVCHASALFLPLPPLPRTVPGGVGTGLAPANVPTLLGLWASGPYLHDGSATTLRDVLLQNPGDMHGVTSTLTAQELDQLVAYLESL